MKNGKVRESPVSMGVLGPRSLNGRIWQASMRIIGRSSFHFFMTPENLGFTDNCITVKTKGDDYA